MSDFESLIRTMMKNGATAEDIAKKTSDVLNLINQEKQTSNEREETLNRLKERFDTAYKANKINIRDVAALCTVVCAHIFPKWGKKELDQFFINVEQNILTTARCMGNDSYTFAKIIDDLTNAIFGSSKETENNSKKKENPSADPGKPTGKPCTCTCKKPLTPEEELLKFLKMM